jgi:hypothetical protein
VPDVPKTKGKCIVKVVLKDASGQSVGSDTSDSFFTIEPIPPPNPTLTSPNGGETLRSGRVHTIAWQTDGAEDLVESVKILYTKNGRTTWQKIALLSGNPGRYDWTVPDVLNTKTECRVMVVLKDSSGTLLGSDASDDDFTIEPN